jgi:hypothetical protein
MQRFIDRDLSCTGELIIVVSAGTGVWEVDSQLARDTKERMIEVGIGCDIISVARPPMHNVPLFRYKNRRTQDMVNDYKCLYLLFSIKHHMIFHIGFI